MRLFEEIGGNVQEKEKDNENENDNDNNNETLKIGKTGKEKKNTFRAFASRANYWIFRLGVVASCQKLDIILENGLI